MASLSKLFGNFIYLLHPVDIKEQLANQGEVLCGGISREIYFPILSEIIHTILKIRSQHDLGECR